MNRQQIGRLLDALVEAASENGEARAMAYERRGQDDEAKWQHGKNVTGARLDAMRRAVNIVLVEDSTDVVPF